MLLEQKITLLAFESEFIKLLHLIKNTGNSFTLKKEKKKLFWYWQNLGSGLISIMSIYNSLDVNTPNSDNIKHWSFPQFCQYCQMLKIHLIKQDI